MNLLAALVLLVVGSGLVFHGLRGSASLAHTFWRVYDGVYDGDFADRMMWKVVGGGVIVLAGLIFLWRGLV